MPLVHSYFATSQATLQGDNGIILLEKLMKVLRCLQVLWLIIKKADVTDSFDITYNTVIIWLTCLTYYYYFYCLFCSVLFYNM